MAFIGLTSASSTPPKVALTYESALAELQTQGWVLTNENPSGAQLRLPKKMRTADKVCIGIGIPLLFVGAGLLLILIGLIDYAAYTKDRDYFLRRELPAMPGPDNDPTAKNLTARPGLLIAGAIALGAVALLTYFR